MSTIAQIIALVDETKPNAFSEGVKVRWIAELDGKIAVDVFLMHHSETAALCYTWPESMNTEPLVPFPHDDIYALWLEAKIDYANGEYNKYQNTMESYNESYSNFRQWFVRTHRPAQGSASNLGDDVTQYYITAYGLAVRRGFAGTLDDWLRSLIGPKGDPGTSPYEFACAGGFEGTEAEFLYKLLHDGKTAWEYAVEGGYKGTEAEFAELLGNVAARGDIPLIDSTLSIDGQAADAAAVGTALAGVNTALAGKLPWGENIIVSKSANTGPLWEQLEKFFTKEKDEIFPYGTVMYCRVSNADPYDNTLPPGGLVAEIAKTGKDESEKYYGYVRLVSYTNDSLGMPREFTRCYMGETGFQDLVERGPAIVAKIEELINAKITAATGVAE